jgi:hypothetical protein
VFSYFLPLLVVREPSGFRGNLNKLAFAAKCLFLLSIYEKWKSSQMKIAAAKVSLDNDMLSLRLSDDARATMQHSDVYIPFLFDGFDTNVLV